MPNHKGRETQKSFSWLMSREEYLLLITLILLLYRVSRHLNMESDVYGSKPECFIIDHKEGVTNPCGITVTAKSSDSQNLENSSLAYCSDTSNQEKKCGYCSATFANQEELVSHLKIHTFICIECDQTFFDAKALTSHMTKHTSKKKWVCEFCFKVFSYRSLLEQHSRSHLGLKPFKCDKCGKQFSRLFNLKVHKHQHTSRGAFHCSHCSRKFSHSSYLSRHMRKVHATPATHQCRLCPKDFPDAESLGKHLKSHNAMEPALSDKPLSCEICNQIFTTINELNLHLQTHGNEDHFPTHTKAKPPLHNTNLQPHNKKIQFKCEICSKSFLKLTNFSHHLKSHPSHEGKEYFCRLCSNQKFTSVKLFLEHQKFKHYGKSPFACEYCHKEFMFCSLYKQHLRRHTGEKPFCCPHCKKCFVRLFGLKTHLKQHETKKKLSKEETGGLTPNYEQQTETDCNDLYWNGSVNLENSSRFEENCQNNNYNPVVSAALVSCQNVNNTKIGQNQIVKFENSCLEQHSISNDGYFSEIINNPTSQYKEEIPPISSLTSSNDRYMNRRTAEMDSENKSTFQDLPLQCDSIFIPDIENQLLSKNLQQISPTLIKEPAAFSVQVSDEETHEYDEDLSITLEILTCKQNSVRESELLDCQPIPSNEIHPKELNIIPVADSSNIDSYTDKSNKDSYVIDLETDLSSRLDTKDLSIAHPNVSNDYMIVDQISTDAVAANNSRILQYLNTQTPESNLILEVDKVNNLLEGTATVNKEISEFSLSGSDLIDLTDEINDTKTNLEFKCSYCEMVCSSSELLNDHLKLHTVLKPFVCGYCQKSFRYSSFLTQHIKLHRKQIHSLHCSQCPKTFPSHKSLNLHLETHRTVHEEPSETLLNCGECGQQFWNLQDLYQHKCISTINVPTNFHNIGNLKPKMHSECFGKKTKGKNNALYTCEYCGKEFKYQSLLTQHLRCHTGEKPFTCPICLKSFGRLFNLEVHQKQHLKKGQTSSLPSAMLHPVCRIKKVASSLSFNKKKSINNSPLAEPLPAKTRKMSQGKKFFCQFCDQSFTIHKDLTKHQHQQHRPFICKFCKKEFRFCSLLIQHLKTHTREKDYQCQNCQKSFGRLFNLKIHQKKNCSKNHLKNMVGSRQK